MRIRNWRKGLFPPISAREGCLIGTEMRNSVPVIQANSSRTVMSEIRALNSSTDVAVPQPQPVRTLPAEQRQRADIQRRTLERDLDMLIRQIFPDHGLRLDVHDSGVIFAKVVDNTTEEVVREFPAEVILDIIHSMIKTMDAAMERQVFVLPGALRSSGAVREARPPSDVSPQSRIPAEYADVRARRTLEYDLDRLIRQIFPDRSDGGNFEIYDSGVILIGVTGSASEGTAREFQAEQIVDRIHAVTRRTGIVTNRTI